MSDSPMLPHAAHVLQARAQGWINGLKLPFRQQRWRGQSGDFMGMGTGSSLDFQDHRVYLPGDDPRQINWQAYARTGTYTMKQYREEVRPQVDLVLDASASMFATPSKEQRTLDLLAFTLEFALQSGAALRSYALHGLEAIALEMEALCLGHWREQLSLRQAGAGAPALARVPFRAGAMRIFISDLLYPAEPEPMLAALASKQGRGIILAPFTQQECAPEWEGDYEMVDAETHRTQAQRVDAASLSQYLQAYARHFALWKHAAIKHGIALARVAAEPDFLTALRQEGLPAGAVEPA